MLGDPALYSSCFEEGVRSGKGGPDGMIWLWPGVGVGMLPETEKNARVKQNEFTNFAGEFPTI